MAPPPAVQVGGHPDPSVLSAPAHRLSTVIDNDLLLVLQDGRIAEYDTPAALLAKEGGLFRSMALESGSLEQLHDASRRSKAAGTL